MKTLNDRLIVLLLLSLIFSNTAICSAITESEVRIDLANTYDAVARAEAAGADVSKLIKSLDEAAQMIPSATQPTLEKAKTIIDGVKTEAPKAQLLGEQMATNRLSLSIILLVVITSIIVLIWWRGSQWIWNRLAKFYETWRVEGV